MPEHDQGGESGQAHDQSDDRRYGNPAGKHRGKGAHRADSVRMGDGKSSRGWVAGPKAKTPRSDRRSGPGPNPKPDGPKLGPSANRRASDQRDQRGNGNDRRGGKGGGGLAGPKSPPVDQ